MNKEGGPCGPGGSAVPGEASFVYYIMFLGGGSAVFRLEMNKKCGSPVRGDAPFVYDVMLFGARLGCLPSGDE